SLLAAGLIYPIQPACSVPAICTQGQPMTATNPLLALLDTDAVPDFAAIEAKHAEPAIDQLIDEARATIEHSIAASADGPDWATLIAPIDDAEERISRAFSPVGHLHAVMDSPAWREAFQACVTKLTAFNSEQGQNTALFEAVKKLHDSDTFTALNASQQRVITNMLRDFHLAGVALDTGDKTRFREIAQRLSELTTQFQQNVLDATQTWQKNV